jgi:hypothetical protein
VRAPFRSNSKSARQRGFITITQSRTPRRARHTVLVLWWIT